MTQADAAATQGARTQGAQTEEARPAARDDSAPGAAARGWIDGWALACRLARREMRGARGGLWVFVLCLALGVGAVAGVGSAASSMTAGLAEQGRALIGGDLELRLTQRPASAAERGFIDGLGRATEVIEMRAMARRVGPGAEASAAPALVEMKAVDDAYPLAGEMTFDPPLTLAEVLRRGDDGRWGVAVEPALLGRLDAKIGDALTIGDATFDIRAVVASESDRVAGGLAFGPRLLLGAQAMRDTGLVREGALARWRYSIALPDGASLDAAVAAARDDWPNAGWRIRDHRDGAPSVRQFLERMEQLLTLVGLAALAIGGVGVANAARGWLESRIETIATLKCLGADGATVFRVYILQTLALALVGVVIGLGIGALAPIGLATFGGDALPVAPSLSVYPGALALAAAYGAAVTLAFAIWPVAQARETPPARLFRDLAAPSRRWPRPGYVVATAALGLAVAGLAFAFSERPWLTLWFMAGLVGALAVLAAAAAGVAALARRLGQIRVGLLRQALASLRRPGAATASAIISLGLGLGVAVTVAATQTTFDRAIGEDLPERAPAYYLIDIQPDQREVVRARLEATPGVTAIDDAPMLRGRITALNGVAPDVAATPSEAKWVLRGDRGLTYSAAPPEGSRIVAGAWWPADYAGPPLVSFDAEIARHLGLKLGDSVSVNVLGREMTATIASLREIDWSSLGINFVMVFSPQPLINAPHAWIMKLSGAREAEGAMLKAATADFPNVSAIGVRDAIQSAQGLVEKIGAGMAGLSLVAIGAGALVLAGALAAGRRARLHDAMVLKALGATRGRILAGFAIEYAMLGAVAATLAGALGMIGAWAVAHFALKVDFVWDPTPALVAIGGTGGVIALAGFAAGWRALGARPADALRAR